ncbi:Ig-like domain-containing protein [Catenovulum sediminis]|uniref:Ig-like domain-containing protein n=1 Tax=Catenovulum sediminis TaxID=1740262 RepID=A0ABV1RFW5_9ALTE|nr:Ig-like domain-containing protein [Catenovulum sediminis]
MKTRILMLLLASISMTGCNFIFDDDDEPAPNHPPMTSDINLTTETDIAIESQLMVEDKEGDMLMFNLLTAPNSGQLTLMDDGKFSYQPAPLQTGEDSFVYQVSDGVNDAVTATVYITIEAQQVSFATYSRQAFEQDESDMPLPVNGRAFTQDVSSTDEYADLFVGE